MANSDRVDQIFKRLVAAPNGLDCQTDEVLGAAGMFVAAILNACFPDQADRQRRADWFCRALQTCVTPRPDTVEASRVLH
jgi:uncharacterized protein YejL (UPF0352 family)